MIVGFGGNQLGTLPAFRVARSELERTLADLKVSSLYRSSAQIDTDQPDFWNAAVSGGWSSTMDDLLSLLQTLEYQLGRQRDQNRPKGPRVLDLDILWAGEITVRGPLLTVPHAGLGSRRFALEPLLELEPLAKDPISHRSYSELCRLLPDQGVERSSQTW